MEEKTHNLFTDKVVGFDLYKDISEVSKYNNYYHQDMVYGNLAVTVTSLLTNIVQIQYGSFLTDTNLYLLVSAPSGKGKSASQKLVIDPLFKIQHEGKLQYDVQKKFYSRCSKFSEKNETKPEFELKKQVFLTQYNLENNTEFTSFMNEAPKERNYVITDFSPETIAKELNNSKNQSILISQDEFHRLRENIERTNSIGSPLQFLASLYDNNNEAISRKSSDSIQINDGKISIVTSTTLDNLSDISNWFKEKWFSSGLGYRFIYITIAGDYNITKVSYSNGDVIESSRRFQDNLDKIYRQLITLQTTGFKTTYKFTDVSHEYFGKKVEVLQDIIRCNANIPKARKMEYIDRVFQPFLKLIAVIDCLNSLYAQVATSGEINLNPERIITEKEIDKAFLCMNYFMQNMLDTFLIQPNEYDKLTDNMKKLYDNFDSNARINKSEIVRYARENNLAKKTAVYDFMSNKKYFTPIDKHFVEKLL